MFVMTWDLKRNVEYSLAQIPIPDIKNPEDMVCKGRKEKFNYFVTKEKYYDF